MDDNLIVCRCEEITVKEIKDAVQSGLTTLAEIRKFTRAGMGLCQGRTCQKLVLGVLKECGLSLGAEDLPKPRPPVVPVTLGELADSE